MSHVIMREIARFVNVKPKTYESPSMSELKRRKPRLVSTGTRIRISSSFHERSGMILSTENPEAREKSTSTRG